jgi:putative ABC transport system substrate-binding protein
MMKRREFITLLGAATAAWPFIARAQQPAMPLIGYLSSESPAPWASRLRSFRQGLGEAGYVEGRNVAIEFRWAESQYDRMPALAADLLRRQPTMIFAAPGIAALAAKAATTTVPIVFAGGIDPIDSGLVASLNRPGGNVTGATNLNVELGPKRLDLLHELIPMATTVAYLFNPTNPVDNRETETLQAATRSLGLHLLVVQASSERDFDAVFASLLQMRAGALLMSADSFLTSRSQQLAALTMRHAVPALFGSRQFAVAGGLASYGGSIEDAHRLAGIYAGRILKGEKPADLPVQQSTKVELIINLKTAKALGITFPLALLTRADEVIE